MTEREIGLIRGQPVCFRIWRDFFHAKKRHDNLQFISAVYRNSTTLWLTCSYSRPTLWFVISNDNVSNYRYRLWHVYFTMSMSVSMWSLRWHFTNKSVTGAPYSRPLLKITVCHTAGQYGEEYDGWNSVVLRSWRNCSSDGAERTDDVRAFHARAAVTGKVRSPSLVRRVDGMTSVDVEALWRRRREPRIVSGTFSQCSSRRSEVMRSDFLAENTKRAAALKTDCSHCNSCPEIPERTELQ